MPPLERLVVLVEDDLGMREALTKVLNASGFRALPFSSAEALLEVSDTADAACFVLDIRLPGLSGFELFRRLKAAGSTAPAIFITAQDDDAGRDLAKRLGAASYLAKPFSGRALLQAIDAALALPVVP